jgi:tetratricopeptide (TPR) repeat protein
LNKSIISIFTNRALAYSKKKLDANVIADTTYVIENLTKENVKAFYRRAAAYKNYGQYKEALSDLSEVLAIEPANVNGKKDYTEVKKLYEDELTKKFEKEQKKVQNLKPKPEPQAKPMVQETTAKPKIQEISNPIVSSKPAPEPKKRVKIDEKTIEKAVKIASSTIGKEKIRIPNTAYGFEADVNSLKKNDEELFSYISNLPPSTYSKIYKNIDIQADYLVIILDVFNKFETDNDKILNMLYHFSMTQNITMTMMFFNDKDRELIEELIVKATKSSIPNKDKLLEKARSMID